MDTVHDPDVRRQYSTAFKPRNHRQWQRMMVGRECSKSCLLCEREFGRPQERKS